MISNVLRVFMIWTMVGMIPDVHGYIDLYLNANETASLVGYTGSFFYLFNGELRTNSIRHRLEVPYGKDGVEFTWRMSGPSKMHVDYRLDIHDLNSVNNRTHRLSINSTGQVPNRLSKFELVFNCSQMSKFKLNATTGESNHEEDDYMDVLLSVYFKVNDMDSPKTIDFQLISMPPINFTISYRKYCVDKQHLSPDNARLNKQALLKHASTKKSNFTIAYAIIGMLMVFLLSVFVYAYVNKRRSAQKAKVNEMSKYESLSKMPKLSHVQSAHRAKPSSYRVKKKEPCDEDSKSLKSNGYLKNSQNCRQKTRQPYAPKTIKPVPQTDDDSQLHQQANSPSSNIYETVPDQSVNPVYDEETKKSQTKAKLTALNVTTNTIMSNFNNASVMTYKTKSNQVDLCARFGREQIQLNELKLEGTFSRIYEGLLRVDDSSDINNSQYDNEPIGGDAAGQTRSVRVMVKTVNEYASIEQADLMLAESCMLRGFKHKNINPILAVCLDDLKFPMTVFAHCEFGNLKTYFVNLRKRNLNAHPKADDEPSYITTQEILYIILQLLKGVNYLHSKHFVHRDIAARNCWLGKNFSLKLADYSLSRDIFPQDYHCLADNENKPVYWMSLESLRKNAFNVRTDIWSCGVAIWECFTLCMQPYETIDPFEFADYLAASEKHRLDRVLNCPLEVFQTVERCWLSEPHARPTLKELFNCIHKYYNSLTNYV